MGSYTVTKAGVFVFDAPLQQRFKKMKIKEKNRYIQQ
jgi:hypothetical protein